MTIIEAIKKIREVVASEKDHIAVDVEVWQRRDEPLEVTFKIWDGQESHQATTLEAAVSTCLAAHGIGGSIGEAQARVDELADLAAEEAKV